MRADPIDYRDFRRLDREYGEAEDCNPNLTRCAKCEVLMILSSTYGVTAAQPEERISFTKPTCPNCGGTEIK